MTIDPVVGAYALAIMSALLHAYWNFLLKQRGGTTAFVGLSKLAEAVLLAPVFLVVLWRVGVPAQVSVGTIAGLVAGGTMLTLLSYAVLARAYRDADLSIAYPVSRGAGLLCLPLLGALVFGEHVNTTGWIGLVLILAGVACVPRAPQGVVHTPRVRAGVAFALATGVVSAVNTIWDKRAVGVLPTFLYFYGYTFIVAGCYGAYLLVRAPTRTTRPALVNEWRTHRAAIVQVGLLNTCSYLLILFALRGGVTSYVIGLRQVSIAVGVGLGWWRLGEPLTVPRRLGLVLLIAGCAIVASA